MMLKSKTLIFTLFTSLMLLVNGIAYADAELKPDALLKSTTYNLISALKKNKKRFKSEPGIVRELVKTHISPKLDFIAASRWVLGKHWRDASREQKVRFIKEFRKLLIQFYSSALTEYAISNDIDHDIMAFKPIRDKDYGSDVTVHSIVSPPSSQKKVPVNYHMHKTRKGWKIYDVSVEGISMITTYKSSFAPQLRNSGVDGLTDSLVKRNMKLASNQ